MIAIFEKSYCCMFKLNMVSGAQKNTFGTSNLVCRERGSRISDVKKLIEILQSQREGKTYWLPYRKETLAAWTWVNNNTYSKIMAKVTIGKAYIYLLYLQMLTI